MCAIAIMAVLVAAAMPFIIGDIQWAQSVNYAEVYTELNEALIRYQGEGGSLTALTVGAPIADVITALKTPVQFANYGTHQFLNSAFTYPARSIFAMGNGSHYAFYQVGTYCPQQPPFLTPTSQYPCAGQGVGYMANGGAQAYSINVTSSSTFYAVQPAGGSITVYSNGTHSVGTANSITFWACAGPAGADTGTNSRPSGNITALTCTNNQLTALDVSGLTSLNSL